MNSTYREGIAILGIIAITASIAFFYSLDTAADCPTVPDVMVLKSDLNSTIITIDLHGIQEEEIEVDGQIFQILTIPGYDYTSEVGKPQMPVIRETIGIPDNSVVKVNILNFSSFTLNGYRIYPFQPPEVDQDDKFVIDDVFYSQETFYPDNLIELGEPGIWRDLSIINLQVNPVMFNPSTGELKIYDHITVELQFSGGINGEKVVSPTFARMYESIILNYDYLNIVEKHTYCGGYKYLAITDPAFVDDIQPLIDWHDRSGLKAFLVDTTLTGRSATAIKAYITAFYIANFPDLEYVLLVGDIDDIPWYTKWGVGGSDYWYGCICGRDLYAEVAVGRITATTGEEVAQQVNKILKYEIDPPIGDWVDRVLLIAHKEFAPGKYQQCKEEIRTATYTDPFIFDTAYGASITNGGDEATNEEVNNKINAGRGIIDYRGHGGPKGYGTYWGTDWNVADEEYTTQDAHALSNGDMTPVVFSISCENAHLDSRYETLGEAFVKNDDGAVAFLGATRPSYTLPNHDFDKNLFDAIGNRGIYRIGEILNYANAKLIDKYKSTYYEFYAAANVKMYLWLGDPALELWTSVPSTMNVTYPSNVSGEMTVVVTDGTAPIADALVCVRMGDLYVTGISNCNGTVTLSLPATSEGTADVTVTKHNYLPWQGTVEIKKKVISSISIEKPNGYLYIFDRRIIPLPQHKIMVIGGITIEVDVRSGEGIDKVDFYVDDVLKYIDNEYPYKWRWDETIFGSHNIKVVVYDNTGNIACDDADVIIFNIG
ncbi:MAG: hypothetical protein FE048_01360 [Thermoplasmata archaeon]|nr:MAG: hypothetical protein FE048_01360 [Thermoplasmata archaeon]